MKKNNNVIDFDKIFKGKKIPILTLDERWYELFQGYDKPVHIEEIEYKLNSFMQRQGKLTNDMKDLKNLKSNLMKEIITHMDVDETQAGMQKAKKLDRNQKLIKEISEKMKNTEDELADIPYLIKEINEQLIIESAIVCYKRLKFNNQKVSEISDWVTKARDELKEKILLKQDLEMKSNVVYSYMHDMLGPEVLQFLDDSLKDEA